MFNSIRVRLTLWYVLIFGALLVAFSVFIYLVFARNLRDKLDHSLLNASVSLKAAFQNELNEGDGDAKFGASEVLRENVLPDIFAAFYENNTLLATNFPEEIVTSLPQGFPGDREKRQGGFSTLALYEEKDDEEDDGARVLVVSVELNQHQFLIVALTSLHDTEEELEAMSEILYTALPLALLVAGGCGFLLAKKSLAPVVAMLNQARSISAKNLHERLPVANSKDELGQLAGVFNELLSRLNHSFAAIREFMADASHELRTPIAIIRGESEVALLQNRDTAEYRESLKIIEDEASILSRLVDDMLALARADAGERHIKREEFYLNDLVEDCCRAAQALALRKEIALTFDSTADIIYYGDEEMLRRLLLNLLDNAIKYTPIGGMVSVKLTATAKQIDLEIADTGIGIPAGAIPYIFERFYRVEKARSRADGGSGLGLAIAKWVAEAHHGSIRLQSHPSKGSTFIVSLPITDNVEMNSTIE